MFDMLCNEVIESELGSQEKLLWSGQPRQGIVFYSSDLFMIPFSIVWVCLSFPWELISLSTLKNGVGLIADHLFEIAFVIVGLYLLFGRFMVDSIRRKKTFYGVTDRKVIIVSGIFNRASEYYDLKTLSNLSFQEKTDGSGTIYFGPAVPPPRLLRGKKWPGQQHPGSAFEMIGNVRQVYEMIRQAQELN